MSTVHLIMQHTDDYRNQYNLYCLDPIHNNSKYTLAIKH